MSNVPLASKPKSGPSLYAECSCDDFAWRRGRYLEYDDFVVRWQKAQRVMVAKHTDLLILPEMSDDKDSKWCVWRDNLDVLRFYTITRGKISTGHQVTMTVDAGQTCDWVCKHILCAARWVWRHKHGLQNVYICWEGDPLVTKAIAWDEHQAGGLVGVKWARLYNGVYVLGWHLSEQKGL